LRWFEVETSDVFTVNARWTISRLLRLLRRLPIITDFTHDGEDNRYRSMGSEGCPNDPSRASPGT
jgi:hypothetical protein